MALQTIELYHYCRHTGATQHLGQRPKLVGLILRLHNKQPVRLDPQPHGRRWIKLFRSIEHHEPAALATCFPGNK